MKEEITSFCPDSGRNYPFILEMAGISYCDGSYKIKREIPDIYVFEYVLGGEGTVRAGAREFHPSEGDIYILHRGSRHEYFSDDKNPWTKIWFNAKGSLIDSLVEVYGLNNINHIKGLDLSDYFYRILTIAKTQELDTKEIFEKSSLVFHEILVRIASYLDSISVMADNEALKVKKYLDSHLKEKLHVEELARVIFKSTSQTIRLFKKEYDCTPYNYLINKRLDMAELLLLNSNMSVKEIADYLCFADQHYFCNCFKSKTGKSPRAFRGK